MRSSRQLAYGHTCIRTYNTYMYNTCTTHTIHLFTVQWVLDYLNPDYPYLDIWTSAHVAMFSVPAGKGCCGQWSFATGESKAAGQMTFTNTTTLFFHAVRDLDHDYNVQASCAKLRTL